MGPELLCPLGRACAARGDPVCCKKFWKKPRHFEPKNAIAQDIQPRVYCIPERVCMYWLNSAPQPPARAGAGSLHGFFQAAQQVCGPPQSEPHKVLVEFTYFQRFLHQNRDFCITHPRAAWRCLPIQDSSTPPAPSRGRATAALIPKS